MKILICLNKDVYCAYALNLLLKDLSNHQIKIYFSDKVGIKPINDQELIDLQKAEGDLSKENFDPYKLQILDFKNINHDGYDYLKNTWTPDLIISIRFGQIFKNLTIELPKFGIINLHSGILPNYRGVLATFWSMLNNEDEIGTTLHFINDESIDTGDIISITKCKIDYKKSLMANIFRLYTDGVGTIVNFVDAISNNLQIKTVKQDKSSGKYYSYPEHVDIKKFLDLNLSFK